MRQIAHAAIELCLGHRSDKQSFRESDTNKHRGLVNTHDDSLSIDIDIRMRVTAPLAKTKPTALASRGVGGWVSA
jgi:hypothetical protein